MVFVSFEYIVLFLPAAALIHALLSSRGHARLSNRFLLIASLLFYGWWSWVYLLLLCASVSGNFVIGEALRRRVPERPDAGRGLLAVGIALNIVLLGYFKYANFFVDNVASLTGLPIHLGAIVLPLAISFHTFQQIGYLVDCRRGEVPPVAFPDYALFVTFFPQLIAGPIVRPGELLPQIGRPRRPDAAMVAEGVLRFLIGAAKKVVIADSLAPTVATVFGTAQLGGPVDAAAAWTGALCYALQLYFDFSAYADMAVGSALLFGIRLPENFNRPYRATSIVEFWRRWHMTLSRWLRDYVYIPLGGNRRGHLRRYVNLLATMLLGGIWHGAGWTFLAWGAMHGVLLAANNLFREVCAQRPGLGGAMATRPARVLAWALTMVLVLVAWVLFRAPTIETAAAIIGALVGVGHGGDALRDVPWAIVGGAALWILLPREAEIASAGVAAMRRHARWQTAIAVGCGATLALVLSLLVGGVSPFLYFDF